MRFRLDYDVREMERLVRKDTRGHDSWVNKIKYKPTPKCQKPTKEFYQHPKNEHSNRPKD